MARAGSDIRMPAVAGRFYPDGALALADAVERHLRRGANEAGPRRAAAVMAPHAGYVFSGAIAGRVFARVRIPQRVVVLGPNHTGLGRRVAVARCGAFRLPGGDVPVDRALADAVLDEVPGAAPDLEAHRHEHGIEVELPFLRARRPDVRVVPVVVGGLREREVFELGRGLARAIARTGGDALVVASSDMSHFLPDAEARRIDRVALEPLLANDPGELYRTVTGRDISMCGVMPAAAALVHAGEVGGGSPELVGYATSGDASGDRRRVVGYAGVTVTAG